MASELAEAANKQANELFLAGKVKEAIDGYSKAIGIDSRTAKYFGNRSNAYLQVEKFQKAANDADKAVELDPTVPKYVYRAAAAYFALGNLDHAFERATQLLRLDPTNADGSKMLEEIRKAIDLRAADASSPAAAKLAGERHLKDVDNQPGIYRLPSGLRFKILRKSTTQSARSPTLKDPCIVHYHGTLPSGEVFDSSCDRGEPATFAPCDVISGWTEALQYMCEGEKWEVHLPYNLAYGARGSPPDIPPFAALIFTIELIEVLHGKGKTGREGHESLSRALGVPYDFINASD
jgi:FKBP-type peptidyl-prolyl cis-trans isomerase FklB